MAEDYTGELPDGWTGGQAVTKWWRGQYVHLYTLKKRCAECEGEMRIDVTRDAIEGKVHNAGLKLKRCANCRAKSKALGTSSRPKVEGQMPWEPAPAGSELETLRTVNETMRQELESVYAENRELRERLAKYELPAMFEAAAAGKMPWEG